MRLHTLLASLIVLSAVGSRVSAEDGQGRNRFVSVPVIFVTDRAAKKAGYGPRRKFETIDTINDLHCGWFDYSLKAEKAITDQQTKLGWTESEKRSGNVLSTRPLKEVKNYKDLGPVIVDTAKKSGTKDVFVMIHGFNTRFAEAAKGAALLTQSVQRPVILYSWPSKGKIGQYNVDLGNNEWSQEHFDAMLEELKSIKDTNGINFVLVAHSMGNRLVVRSAPVLQGKHLFSQMFLVDPDFDAETFVHYLVRYGRKTDEPTKEAASTEPVEPTKVRILFSHKDHALPMSEFIFGGYTRLGQAADSLLSTVVAPYTIPEKLSEAFGDAPDTRGAADRIQNQASKWLMNFQWIDYTILDHGIIGHTVPFELIASLWSTNMPGEGLKMVHSDNGPPNKLSRMFGKLFGESDHISSKIDSAEKVVFDKDAETTNKPHN
ncbi:MAG: alpha/beta hydrolase [Cyanobacteria bacterium SZAS-4]|nr:alpha/beta hydrolase [Cyanobacteria bacterium SZAS-4]